MKKILALAIAFVMVMALTVSVFADVSLLDSVSGTINEQTNIPLPEDLDVSNGATVTVIAKGTSDNAMVRFYLTDAADAGRVTEVAEVPVEGGVFDTTIEFVIDSTGAIQGSAAPTHLMFKGPDYATPPANVVFETLTIVTGGAAAPATTETTPAPAATGDTVLFEHEFTDAHDDGWWEDTSTNGFGNDADFIAALRTEGAKLVIEAAAATAEGYQYGFQDTTSWVNVLVHFNFEGGEGNLGAESVEVEGDRAIITADAAALMAAADAEGAALSSYNWINGAGTGDTYKISVVVPGAPAAPAPATSEPAPSTPAPSTPAPSTTTAPNTGLALAVVPAVVALAAVAVSKKH